LEVSQGFPSSLDRCDSSLLCVAPALRYMCRNNDGHEGAAEASGEGEGGEGRSIKDACAYIVSARVCNSAVTCRLFSYFGACGERGFALALPWEKFCASAKLIPMRVAGHSHGMDFGLLLFRSLRSVENLSIQRETGEDTGQGGY
jgi:hypothetical protein